MKICKHALSTVIMLAMDFPVSVNAGSLRRTRQRELVDDCNARCPVRKELPADADVQQLVEDYLNDENETDIGCWNTSQVTSMEYAFFDKDFNDSLDCWDTGSVETMEGMFYSNPEYNHPVNHFKTSKVKSTKSMFYGASKFNQRVDAWDLSSVTTMEYMFAEALAFNQRVENFDTSKVEDMNHVFLRAEEFDQPVDAWNTSSVSTMSYMFHEAKKFNQPVENLDTSGVKDMKKAFYLAEQFNQPVDAWDVSSVTTMESMFQEAKAFNRCLSSWNGKTTGKTTKANGQVVDKYVNKNDMFQGSSCPNGSWCCSTGASTTDMNV